MLRLQNIVKSYDTGASTVHALQGIDIAFRKNEFVAILGPSGCGKTTLLNIVGGLDRYSSGDLNIRGKSTKHFKDHDWDTYRNHSVGFVFQTYNLIPHQTVLSNVELALTLSGVSKSERRKRATEVLTQVGLADQLHKRPNQMSGGQMQRVAIARALINDPDILLADEPTGALDTETSTQVMEILKEVAKDRLVIMVTHNPELAERYATRIVRLLDGKIISDTDPYDSSTPTSAESSELSQPSMSFATALSLSMNNLLTKKARTLLTAFAGSIGIIGIALILSLSSGFQSYISDVEEETLASYPITIEQEAVDASAMMSSMQSVQRRSEVDRDPDAIHVNTGFTDLMNLRASQVASNDLARFKSHVDQHMNDLSPHLTAISYSYDVGFTVYAADTSQGLMQVHPSTLFDTMGMSAAMELNPNASAIMSMSGFVVWDELLDNQEFLQGQYDVLAGGWPQSYDEVVLIVDDNNEISDIVLYSLGLADPREAAVNMQAVTQGRTIEAPSRSYTYDEILGLRFKLVLGPDYYAHDEASGRWLDKTSDASHMQNVLEEALELKISGVLRPREGSISRSVSGSVGYTPALTDYVIDAVNAAAIVRAQLENPNVNVFSGLPFGDTQVVVTDGMSAASPGLSSLGMTPGTSNGGSVGALGSGGIAPAPGMMSGMTPGTLSEEQLAYLMSLSDEDVARLLAQFQMQQQQATSAPVTVPADSYEEVLSVLGVVDPDRPSRISLYAKDFESRDAITSFISSYNQTHRDAGEEQYVITYTDFIRMMMSSVTSIINSISYVLIAFVGISLVVSSIMIGIITYISVLERTKEIGILRSIGASKRDIARVFNAETLLIGFVSGALGIAVTVLLNVPINMIIESVSDIPDVAGLPPQSGIVLIAISMGLTLIAGLIPSRIAAKKDPVVALRTE